MTIEVDKDLPVIERVEEASPLHIERKEVVTPTPTNFTAQVHDDNGQPLIKTTPTKVISITIPSDQNTLSGWSKGNVIDSLTWYALFWLRMIKKAVHFGWRIVVPQSSSS